MAPPPAPANSKKRRQRMLIIGAAGAALLLLLYLRSRSSSSASANATNPQDLQNAYSQGAQNQAQTDAAQMGAGGGAPSTFADNGANAAALGDALTNAINTFETQTPSWFTGSDTTAGGGGAPPAPPAPSVTINVNGTGTGTAKPGTGTKGSTNTKTTTTPRIAPGTRLSGGVIEAPSGPHRPPPKPGYSITGAGGGRWLYKPLPRINKTGSSGRNRRRR